MVQFGIYQTDADWTFRDYDFAMSHGFDGGEYAKVYDLEMPDGAGLEDVFTKLNVDHPADYTGRSLSVSDIVERNGRYYYVDSIGFKEVAASLMAAAA